MTPDAAAARARRASGAQALQRPVVVMAVSREGEEPPLLQAWREQPAPRPLLLLVPRHPQRFDEVAADRARRRARPATAQSAGPTRRRPTRTTADVWLGDSLGEMPLYYAHGRRGPARRQLRAAGRAEPDRGRGLRLSGGDGAAHLQLRAGRRRRWRPARRCAWPTSMKAWHARRADARCVARQWAERAAAFAQMHRARRVAWPSASCSSPGLASARRLSTPHASGSPADAARSAFGSAGRRDARVAPSNFSVRAAR